MSADDKEIVQQINDATARLPWFPDLQIKPYQRRMWAMLSSIPGGYKPEFYRGPRMKWCTIAKAEGKPALVYRDGQWQPLNASSSPTPSPEKVLPA